MAAWAMPLGPNLTYELARNLGNLRILVDTHDLQLDIIYP